eukprot:4634679-Pleurochrysis_carterae.AAC.1
MPSQQRRVRYCVEQSTRAQAPNTDETVDPESRTSRHSPRAALATKATCDQDRGAEPSLAADGVISSVVNLRCDDVEADAGAPAAEHKHSKSPMPQTTELRSASTVARACASHLLSEPPADTPASSASLSVTRTNAQPEKFVNVHNRNSAVSAFPIEADASVAAAATTVTATAATNAFNASNATATATAIAASTTAATITATTTATTTASTTAAATASTTAPAAPRTASLYRHPIALGVRPERSK